MRYRCYQVAVLLGGYRYYRYGLSREGKAIPVVERGSYRRGTDRIPEAKTSLAVPLAVAPAVLPPEVVLLGYDSTALGRSGTKIGRAHV